ncbi:Lrp/AsnC ligand binding domain-containing protein [Novosphingobium sp. 1949]|uniref:Lrp/AsnC ligand binding domain-containing protein n=1 Tax=Novosphingobium organovorum TaxID=2930092 RepID=A0ABT0BHW9_9SPHN|nr:Lrp/AsnC ligand binding domain-containing protein [Novosphingobium organovorum]MCJ2184660.1 Lrp/AsnC ligand binding domain-containing protein [Novosphingobium organovorum]
MIFVRGFLAPDTRAPALPFAGHRKGGDGLDHYRDFLANLTQIPGVAHIQSSFTLGAFINRSSPNI